MLTFEPSQFTYTAFVVKTLDTAKLEKAYDQDPKQFLKMFPIRSDSGPVHVVFKGELSTDGIYVPEEENYAHSLGLTLNDSENYKAVENWSSFLDSLAEQFSEPLNYKGILKNDTLYFKLPTTRKGDKYDFQSDIPLNPKQPKESALHRHQEVEVTCALNVWINLKDGSLGLSTKVIKLKTKLQPETPAPTPKRFKKN